MLDVGPAWNVNGHPVLREGAGHGSVGDPSSIGDPRPFQSIQRVLRVTNPAHRRLEAEFRRRTDEIFTDCGRPFVIAPVPDPDKIAGFLCRWLRPEDSVVSGLMPCEDVASPAGVQIALA